MPRVRIDVPVSIPAFVVSDDEQGETLNEVISSSRSVPKKPKRKPSITPSRLKAELSSFDAMFSEKDGKTPKWKIDPTHANPEHAVSLFFRLHEKIYSVRPAELETGPAWFGAVSAARKLYEKEFGKSGTELFDFVIWVFQRERDTIEWLRKTDKPAKKPISWFDMFVDRKRLTHYRQAMAEEKERGKRR